MAEIKAEEKALRKVLSGDYLIEIPPYQRPYAWTEEQVSELLGDLQAAMKRSRTTPYFLGSIVMIQVGGGKRHELIDGQQRLTTLTMLLCVVRDLTSTESDQEQIDKYIAQRADKYEGTDESPRLLVRERDRKTFKEWVQQPGGTSKVPAQSGQGKTDSQQRIAENVEFLRKSLKVLSAEQRDALVKFVVQYCYLIVATTTDRESAYRMFSVLNSRGLDLSPTDILKADVIGALPTDQQRKATDTWESYEDNLGRESFRDLFQAICSIYLKDKIHHALSSEFQNAVLGKMSADKFLDTVLVPYADAYSAITDRLYPEAPEGHEVNRVLRNLMSLGDYTVLPPAMAYMRHIRGDADKALTFFRRLERLAFGLQVLRTGVEARIRRFAKIVKAIEQTAETGDQETGIDADLFALTSDESRDIISGLNGPIGKHKICRQLLLLLDGAMADAGVQYDLPNCTIEHVLPQTPTDDSPWLADFPDEEVRDAWTQKLANLVLLSRRKNSAASNYEFPKKRDKYFKSGKFPTFALTQDVLERKEWTVDVLSERQEELIGILKNRWELSE